MKGKRINLSKQLIEAGVDPTEHLIQIMSYSSKEISQQMDEIIIRFNEAVKIMKSLLKDATWEYENCLNGENHLYYTYLKDGSRISVLDRLTGYSGGIRDIESGYKDVNGKFWLASGGFDIRDVADENTTIEEAIALIKENANTCIGG